MVGASVALRHRPAPPSPADPPSTADPPSPAVPATPEPSPVDLASRYDVERVLNEKMKGKSKSDYKGRSEQMTEYIKRLRTCIRWLLEREDGNMVEIEESRSLLESEEKRHADTVAQMRNDIEELNATIDEHRRESTSMQERLMEEEAEKLAAIKSYEEEKEARLGVEKSRDALLEDLAKAGQEEKCLQDQIKLLQESNKRLQDYNASLQQYNSNLQADVVKNGETISKLNEEKNTMKDSLTGLRNNLTFVKNQLDTSRALHLESIKQKDDLQKEIDSLTINLQQTRDDRDHQLAQIESLISELCNYKELTEKAAKEMENTCNSQREIIQTLQDELGTAKEKLKMIDLTAMRTMSENEEQKITLKTLQNRLADAEDELLEAENIRKELHNTIMELKGNIRVFCRVRPSLSGSDCNSRECVVVSFPTSMELRGRGIELMHNSKSIAFTYDKVFNPESSQEDIFIEISQLVQSALDGYKVCIFAYGQTGSGKTYTMMGTTEKRGLIPRSLEQIFETSQSKLSQGWKYKMQASMLEIYNETIRDLLASSQSGSLDIKHDANSNSYVPGLTVVDVCSINEVSFLLRQAAQSRSVGWTQMNEQSSRSHFVFTLRISGVNQKTEQQVQGVLNLIDLAGSERLSKSGSTGDRLKETQAINKSLSALRDVICALTNKKTIYPIGTQS
ncbi:kinesin-like protein KIN-14N [Iris pallida]|uniref:Kinesin-like protein n=1 Tax=Iris pallida TaxID=29817 RepID=A0AAX6HQ18_IRIPA|nr:kinesin-like protein KIN-14N [Iris pallida]